MSTDGPAGPLLDDGEVERLATELVARIRATIPSYESLPYDEHRQTVARHLALQVRHVSAGEPPPPDVLRLTGAAARRRAHYGMPVYDVLAAFHVVGSGLWEELRHKYASRAVLLVDLVGLLTQWTQGMSQAVVDAYVGETGSRNERERGLRQRLFEALAGAVPAGGLDHVLSELAFDPRGPFTVLCSRREPWSLEDIEYLQRSSRRWSGVCHVGTAGEHTVVVVQDIDLDVLTARIAEVDGGAIGIGLTRAGAAGVPASLADAAAALRVATARGVPSLSFADGWLECALLPAVAALSPLLERPMAVAGQAPDLATAVTVFSEAGFTLAEAARRMHLHPNSVAYRLNRWHELTGLDPRRFPDLALSLLGISHARTTHT